MGIKIHKLPVDIANQIAAGEVVERPASVVKELLENSCDANADRISIEIGFGGLNLIRIADNGSGISAEDLPLAVMAHATSKICCLEDLYSIHSMGFRGEALASIASVAKVTITSKSNEALQANSLQYKNLQWQVEPCARSQGTTVEVRDLFYNAPVRKKFLKSERSEFQLIEQVVKRFALAQPHIAIVLHHNERKQLELPAATQTNSLAARVTKVLGKAFYQHAIQLNEQRANMQLTGWISNQNYQRSQKDKQWVYVNQRMVRDKLLTHAIQQAYEESLHPGRHPACVLYLEIPPAEVDVNVHPTKHELRFVQPRLVHDFIVHTLQNALAMKPSSSSQPSKEIVRETLLPDLLEGENVLEVSHQLRETTQLQPKLVTSPMVLLNASYSLSFYKENTYLIQNQLFYESFWQWILQQTPKPFAKRPLLIPLQFELKIESEQACEHKIQQLLEFGIQIQNLSETQWRIDSIPAILPQLNIKAFLAAYWRRQTPDNSDTLHLLSKYVEHGVCNKAEDQERLSHFLSAHEHLLKGNELIGIHRLDEAACERVFNV